MTIFGPKPWVNRFGKKSIFPLFELLFFIAQKGVFQLQNIVKNIFLAYIAQKKSWKNGHFWSKTMGQTLMKNGHFSTFSTACFYSLERRFFPLAYHKRHFPGLYCIKKKFGKMAIFGPKPCTNHFGKMSIFPFLNFLFLYPRNAFFHSRIS